MKRFGLPAAIVVLIAGLLTFSWVMQHPRTPPKPPAEEQGHSEEAGGEHQEASARPGLPAPDFTVKDLSEKPVSLSELKGKGPLLLFFWTPKDRMSNSLFPVAKLAAMERKYASKGFDIVNVAFYTYEKRAKGLVDEHRLPGTNLIDMKGDTIPYLPMPLCIYYVLDKEGIVTKLAGVGMPQSWENLEKDLKDLSRGKVPRMPVLATPPPAPAAEPTGHDGHAH